MAGQRQGPQTFARPAEDRQVGLGLVYYADHLVHSIQIDSINQRVERATRRIIGDMPVHQIEQAAPRAPAWARELTGSTSAYVQTIHPGAAAPDRGRGERHHLPAAPSGAARRRGTTIGWVWAGPDDPTPVVDRFEAAIDTDVLIGFERTLAQDIAFGIRQQIDIAAKALSPAVNDPYTAVQVIDHLTVICSDLAVRRLGADIRVGPAGRGRVIVPGNTFSDYILFITRLIGRYGAGDGDVMLAMLRLIRTCFEVGGHSTDRLATLTQCVEELDSDAAGGLRRLNDQERVRAAAEDLRSRIRDVANHHDSRR